MPGCAIFVGSWGSAHSLRGPGFVCQTLSSHWVPSPSTPKAPGVRALGWGWWGQHSWLVTTVPSLVAFGLAPCLPPTPTPCPGRAERLLLPVSISKLGVGVGERRVPTGPVPVPCHLGFVPHPYFLEGPGLLFLLPLCSLELREDARLASIFPDSSLSCLPARL